MYLPAGPATARISLEPSCVDEDQRVRMGSGSAGGFPYEFIGFRNDYVRFPYEFIGFRNDYIRFPYEFI